MQDLSFGTGTVDNSSLLRCKAVTGDWIPSNTGSHPR